MTTGRSRAIKSVMVVASGATTLSIASSGAGTVVSATVVSGALVFVESLPPPHAAKRKIKGTNSATKRDADRWFEEIFMPLLCHRTDLLSPTGGFVHLFFTQRTFNRRSNAERFPLLAHHRQCHLSAGVHETTARRY